MSFTVPEILNVGHMSDVVGRQSRSHLVSLTSNAVARGNIYLLELLRHTATLQYFRGAHACTYS